MTIEMKLTKKMVIVFAVVFFVGFAGGILTEHIVHYLSGCTGASIEGHSHHH